MDAMAIEDLSARPAAEPVTATTSSSSNTGMASSPMDASMGAEPDEKKKRALEETPQPIVICGMCESLGVKYRCPRCERVTCSLECCLAHKKQFDCDGKRDRTKYIPTKQFTDSDLSSDFFFLEEVSRSTNSAARSRSQLGVTVKRYGQSKPQQKKRRVANNDTLAHGETVNPHVPADWLTRFPVAFQLLVQHAAKRGVALTLLAPGMSKRVRNTSYMNTKESKLYWRVEWVFPGAEVPVSYSEDRADDSLTPYELLDKYLERRPENTSIRSKLKQYATPTWRSDVVLLLRKEFTASPQPQYYRLDGHLTLESNLKRKAVVEFPVIIVALPSQLEQYAIVNDLIEVVTQPTAEPSANLNESGDIVVEDDTAIDDVEDEEVDESVGGEIEVDDAPDVASALVASSQDEELAPIDEEMPGDVDDDL